MRYPTRGYELDPSSTNSPRAALPIRSDTLTFEIAIARWVLVLLAKTGHMKIILQRQLADLCVKRLQIHWRLVDGSGRRAEHIGSSFLQLPLHSVIWFG